MHSRCGRSDRSAEAVEEDTPVEEKKKVRGWRNATHQVAIVGVLAFCGPGLFNALNGLGDAGSSDPTVAAVANGCLYCTFALSSYFAGAAFNLFGPRPLFALGGASYAVYALCIYLSAWLPWLASAGGVVLGIGAGLFWTAQGSLMMAYAVPQSRGRLIGLFWIIFNLGGVVGGLLEFGLNYRNHGAAASPASYFSFIAAMLAGAAAAPCLLARPSRVVREDGTSVIFEQAESPIEELREAAQAITDPFVQRNLLFYFASNWFYTYDFSGFNGSQFNVRTRGLNSALFWAAQMLAAWLFGGLLDAPRHVAQRAAAGMIVVVVALALSLGLAMWYNFFGVCNHGQGWDKGRRCALDYSEDFPRSSPPMLVFMLLGAADAMYQNYAYWLMSMAAGDDVRRMVRYSAVYKGAQSLGAGVAWILDLSSSFTYRAQSIVALMLTLGACMPAVSTFRQLVDPLEKSVESRERNGDVEWSLVTRMGVPSS